MHRSVNDHLPSVNNHLRRSRYVPWIVAKTAGKKRGSKKGTPKPYKRELDGGFRSRLHRAMARRGYVHEDGKPANAALAKEIHCSRATIGQYMSEEKPRKTIDAGLLLDLCDELSVTPYWLMRDEGSIDDVEIRKKPLEDVRFKRPAVVNKGRTQDETHREGARGPRDAARTGRSTT